MPRDAIILFVETWGLSTRHLSPKFMLKGFQDHTYLSDEQFVVSIFINTTFLGLQGYAAREFVKLGLKAGELAIISKEAVCFHLLQT